MRLRTPHGFQAIIVLIAGFCLHALFLPVDAEGRVAFAPVLSNASCARHLPIACESTGSIEGDSTRQAPAPVDEEDAWDARGRLQFGVSWLRMHADAGLTPLLYIAANYRFSTNPGRGRYDRVRLGLGGEVGLFYLYPYARLGPELRFGHAVAEVHAGVTAVFLVGPVTPAGAGGFFGGGSFGFIIPGGDLEGFEFNLGFDYIQLLNTERATTPMPFVAAAVRF